MTKKPNLLIKIKSIDLPTISSFVAADKLKVDTSASAELPISYLSPNIQNNFLGLVEQNVPERPGAVYKLTKSSVDGPIRTELGDNHVIFFGQFFDFLKTADQNGWYVAYIMDQNGQVWAVGAGWGDRGWVVGACSVSSLGPWGDGFPSVSCDSDPQTLKSSESDSLAAKIEIVGHKLDRLSKHLGVKDE